MTQTIPNTDERDVALIAATLLVISDKATFKNGSITQRLELFVDAFEVLKEASAGGPGITKARAAIRRQESSSQPKREPGKVKPR